MAWWDFYKLWQYGFESDPVSRKRRKRRISGVGVSQPEAIPDIRQDGSFWGGGRGLIRLHDTNDFIDLSSIANRQARYKEYERLRSVPEIEQVMTVYADEACVSGQTKIATLFDGLKTIKWLAERWEKEQKEFLVYCFDIEKKDYALGWAFNPRLIKTSKTVKIFLDNGDHFICTEDHRILLRNGYWVMAGQLKYGDELMPFYRVPPSHVNDLKTHKFPRIFTFDGWKNQQQFIDEWRTGRVSKEQARMNKISRMAGEGCTSRQLQSLLGHQWKTIDNWIRKEGFTLPELKYLGKKPDRRRVVGMSEQDEEIEVYDLSVRDHENFCTNWGVMHNCQKNENGHILKIECENDNVKEELEFLFFHREMLNIDRNAWKMSKRLFTMGDDFYELVIDPDEPKHGIIGMRYRPASSMYRIETTKGRLVEFQQGNEGPDYESLTRAPVTHATEPELMQTKALRMTPEQVVHFKIGDDRENFYPYGQSLIEPARGPAHQLRLMEDAMLTYRLCLSGETRIRTPDGWKYIKELSIGDIVYSYCPFRREIYETKIIDWKNNGKQKTYKVRSRHIEITGNSTHPIWVERDGTRKYILIKDLIPKKDKLINITKDVETRIRIPKIIGEKWAKLTYPQKAAFRNGLYENRSEIMRTCEAGQNRTSQFLYMDGKSLPYEQAVEICEKFYLDPTQLEISSKGQINSQRINLPDFVTEEFAKLFGFLLGDGDVGEYQMSFSGGTDETQNEYYAGLLRKFFGHVVFERDKRSEKNLGKYVVSSKVACEIMRKMGYIRGAHNKRIPSWVYNANKSIRKAFVEGLSNADGCERYTEAGTWFSTIELCNKKLVQDIKEVWSSIGLCSGKLTFRKRKGGHKIDGERKMPASMCYGVTISERKLPETESILEIAEDEEQDVFDITVDNQDHNFIANATIVHNTRAPERRVFYIDVGQLPPFKAEAFIERMKDQLRKKKIATSKYGDGASAVEERWHPAPADEDYWIPIRPNSNTRIDTLPGATNLGEIDDALYFRNKLFIALNFPKNYFNNEDVASTRVSLSNQDVKFARVVERLQSHMEDGYMEIAERHLILRGYPRETFEDLKISMTPPSPYKELQEAEVITNRINNANSLKGSMLMSDFDILTRWMKYSEQESQAMIARMKIQKLEDLKMQVFAQNPRLLGVGIPGGQSEEEIGTQAGGPNPMLAPGDMGMGMGGMPPMPPPTGGMGKDQLQQSPQQGQEPGSPTSGSPQGIEAMPLADPSDEEIKKYNLEIQNHSSEKDYEEVDYSEE